MAGSAGEADGAGRPTPAVTRTSLASEPMITIDPQVLVRYGARVLDPGTAPVRPTDAPVYSTIYIAERLLVQSGRVRGMRADPLAEVGKQLGLTFTPDGPPAPDPARLKEGLAGGRRTDARRTKFVTERLDALGADWVVPMRMRRTGSELAPPPDAWTALQTYRDVAGIAAGSAARTGQAAGSSRSSASLDHLVALTSGPSIGGSPFTASHGISTPFTASHSADPLGGYAVPGTGGRAPVAWIGPAPTSRFDGVTNALAGDDARVTVAVLDTGVGTHPWLTDAHVLHDPKVDGGLIGLPTDPHAASGVSNPLLGLADPDAGHGTFIAGLIRQACPDARILDIRIFGGSGVVAEADLLQGLQRLAMWHLLGVAGVPGYCPIDVVSLSLGYYHEQPDDAAFDCVLRAPLDLLTRSGVAVVVSAGNDATGRPMYPAALGPYAGGPTPLTADQLPVLAVGACNPDGSVALFSNDGPWVACHCPGAALVSTYPTTVQAAALPGVSVADSGLIRQTIDPDDFSSGFATWSGTSFAAPVLAGRLAARLQTRMQAGDDDPDATAALARGWAAVTEELPEVSCT
jgi:hypothetical protein